MQPRGITREEAADRLEELGPDHQIVRDTIEDLRAPLDEPLPRAVAQIAKEQIERSREQIARARELWDAFCESDEPRIAAALHDNATLEDACEALIERETARIERLQKELDS